MVDTYYILLFILKSIKPGCIRRRASPISLLNKSKESTKGDLESGSAPDISG